MLLNGGGFGDEKDTTEFFSEAKAKNVPTTATDILETDDESTFLDAKEVEDDSDETEKRADATRKKLRAQKLSFRRTKRMTVTKVIIRSKVPSLFLEVRLNQLYLLMAIVILLLRRKLQRKRENRCATTMVLSASKKKDMLSSQSEN